jgi:hypothetical protein
LSPVPCLYNLTIEAKFVSFYLKCNNQLIKPEKNIEVVKKIEINGKKTRGVIFKSAIIPLKLSDLGEKTKKKISVVYFQILNSEKKRIYQLMSDPQLMYGDSIVNFKTKLDSITPNFGVENTSVSITLQGLFRLGGCKKYKIRFGDKVIKDYTIINNRTIIINVTLGKKGSYRISLKSRSNKSELMFNVVSSNLN